MSGGSYDYLYSRIEDMADAIPDNHNPRRTAFKKLLKLIAAACRDIEWVDSGDYGPGGENKAIEECLGYLKAHPPTLAKAAAFDELAVWFKAAKGRDRSFGK